MGNNEKQKIIKAKETLIKNGYSVQMINAEVIIKAIHNCFTDKEIETIEMVIDANIYKLINHNMLQFGVVSIDVSKIDYYINPPYKVGLSEYIIEKYGQEVENLFKKLAITRYIL